MTETITELTSGVEHSSPTLGEIRGPFGDFRFCDVRMHPNVATRHTHETLQICCVVSGAFEQCHQRDVRQMDKRTVRVSPPGTTTKLRFAPEGAQCFLVELHAGDAVENPRLDPRAVTFMTDGESTRLADLLRRDFLSADEPAIVLETLAIELFARALRAPTSRRGPAPVWLRAARDWLHDRYRDDLTLTDVAIELGVTPVHLSRAFRTQFGCTMGTYLRALRVAHVQRMLHAGGDAGGLTQVALDAGFYDQSHMTRVFRQHLGTTPARYAAAAGGYGVRLSTV